VRAALSEDNSERARKGLEKAREKTWDAIVDQMEALMAEAVEIRQAEAKAA
jgi:hypothetical protein